MSKDEDALCREWLPYALACARQAVGGKACYGTEAEDRASDAALGLLHALRRFDPARGKDLKWWIAQIVKRRVIDGIRTRAGRTPGRRARNVVACFQGRTAKTRGDLDAASWRAARREERAAAFVEDAAIALIGAAPEGRDRGMLALRYRGGLTMRQAAARLGLSLSRVSEVEGVLLARLRRQAEAGGERR